MKWLESNKFTMNLMQTHSMLMGAERELFKNVRKCAFKVGGFVQIYIAESAKLYKYMNVF